MRKRLISLSTKVNSLAGWILQNMFSSILLKQNFDSVGSWHGRSLFLGMMHFQDKYNEDLERLQRCDIHYLTPDLRIIPFCAFNVIPEWYRDRIQKNVQYSSRRNGKETQGHTLEAGLYRGLMRRGKPETEMGCALSEMHKADCPKLPGVGDDHRGIELCVMVWLGPKEPFKQVSVQCDQIRHSRRLDLIPHYSGYRFRSAESSVSKLLKEQPPYRAT